MLNMDRWDGVRLRIRTLFSSTADVEAALTLCARELGPVDILINHAGIGPSQHTLEISEDDWDEVIGTNLTGVFQVARSVATRMAERRAGVILNMSSSGGIAAEPGHAHYAASKAGILALTRTLAVEYAKRGLRANAVCPGSIKTAMGSRTHLPEGIDFELLRRAMPLDKPRGPEAVAAVIALLASEDGAHVNGESVRVDGGTLA